MRFSIRGLLALTAGLGVVLTIGLLVTRDYRERMALRNELLELGARYVSVNRDRTVTALFTQPVASSELGRFHSLRHVELKGFRVDARTLAQLSKLEGLDTVMIQSCTVDDAPTLSGLNGLRQVESLHFWSTPVSDKVLDQLGKLSKLRRVSLVNTGVPTAEVERLRVARPDLKVHVRP